MENNSTAIIKKISEMELSSSAQTQIYHILNNEEMKSLHKKNQSEFVSWFMEKVLIPARMIPTLYEARESVTGIYILREWWEEVRTVHDHPTREGECRDSMGLSDARAIMKALFSNDCL